MDRLEKSQGITVQDVLTTEQVEHNLASTDPEAVFTVEELLTAEKVIAELFRQENRAKQRSEKQKRARDALPLMALRVVFDQLKEKYNQVMASQSASENALLDAPQTSQRLQALRALISPAATADDVQNMLTAYCANSANGAMLNDPEIRASTEANNEHVDYIIAGDHSWSVLCFEQDSCLHILFDDNEKVQD